MTNTEKILEEFDEIFPTFNGGKKAIRGLVKSFLTTKIAQALAEERARVRGEIEKLETDVYAEREYLCISKEEVMDILNKYTK